MPAKPQDLPLLTINTIRTLAMDAVQAANSGHPGTPMALAPVVYSLWQDLLRFDPDDPIWPNRDRFVLSDGPRLDAALLHAPPDRREGRQPASTRRLGELSVTLDDIKRFRQLDSKCPGHPEYRWTSGVETTTGPLGQGSPPASAWRSPGSWLAAHFNRPGFDLFDYNVYALCGDGDMMEGITGEAASLAGHLEARPTSAGSTTTTRSPSRATPTGLLRRRRHALHRLRLERHPRRRRQRSRDAASRPARLQEHHEPPDPHHRRQPHRLRRAQQAGHRRRPRRAAGRGGDPSHQAVLRLAGGRQVPGARRRPRTLAGRDRPPRARAARGLEGEVRGVRQQSIPSWPTISTGCSDAACPTDGIAIFPSSPRIRKASPAATRRARC